MAFNADWLPLARVDQADGLGAVLTAKPSVPSDAGLSGDQWDPFLEPLVVNLV